MRVDTTVVETDIHYPTDASLLGDGVRVLTRAMKRITAPAGGVGATLRDRTRSTRRCLVQIGRASRSRGEQGKQRMWQCYRRLMAIAAGSSVKPNASYERSPTASSAAGAGTTKRPSKAIAATSSR